MTEWEYMKLDFNQISPKQDETDVLNRAGGEGWELVALTPNNLAYLKRPIVRQPPVHAKRGKERSLAG